MKTLTGILTLITALGATAQISNNSFEDWGNFAPHTYESEMIGVHQVPDPIHGDINDWTFDYYVGVSRTTDAADGNYAVVVHNWYGYGKTSLIYRGTIASYPDYISGMYKMVNGHSSDSAYAHVIVKSTADEIMIEEVFGFGDDNQWTSFSHPLNLAQTPVDPADSIYILFHNGNSNCDSTMTCNLLFLDKIELNQSTASMDELSSYVARVYPNPAENTVHVSLESLPADGILDWQIIDFSGRVQLDGTLAQTHNSLNVSSLGAGTYILKISNQGALVQREHIVIR